MNVYKRAFVSKDAYEQCTQEDFIKLSYISICMMLYGYSLECLLKGIYLVNNYGELDRKIKSHNLIDIFNFANTQLSDEDKISLNDKEHYLLERLSTFTIWAGKYPLPLNFEELMPCESPSGGYIPLSHSNLSDNELINVLYERFVILIKKEREKSKH